MKRNVLILLFLFLIFFGCSSYEGSLKILLPPDVHLVDTTAGSFLRHLRLNYTDEFSFVMEIRKSLKLIGSLEDEYTEGENKKMVRRWRIYKEDSSSFILYEKIVSESVYFVYPLGANGVHYADLIGEKVNDLKPNRKKEAAVYINSKADGARLILYGFGDYCTSMMIIEGAL